MLFYIFKSPVEFDTSLAGSQKALSSSVLHRSASTIVKGVVEIAYVNFIVMRQ